MNKFRRLAYGVGLLLLAFVIVGVFLPSSARVQRAAQVDAPAATVFVLAGDARRIAEWSPWVGPAASLDLAGRAGESPETMRWQGGALGNGSLTFIDRAPYERVTATVQSGRDRELLSRMEVDDTGAGTRVRWQVETDFGVNLLARYGGLWFESRTGEILEHGLDELATLAESLPRADWSELDIERLEVQPGDIAYLTASSLPNAAAISEAMGAAYFNVLAFMDRHGLEEAGPPLSISRRFSGSEFVFDAAIPVRGIRDDTPRTEGGIRLGQTWGGPVVRGRHIGSYRRLSETHEKIAAWLAVHGVARAGDAWEAYVSDPTRTPEAELVTEVYYPIEGLQGSRPGGSQPDD
jgi:hypothetical protein